METPSPDRVAAMIFMRTSPDDLRELRLLRYHRAAAVLSRGHTQRLPRVETWKCGDRRNVAIERNDACQLDE
jgi:hypothetical protein